MEKKQIGGLETLCSTRTGQKTCVVFFHGYGADASDLVPLSEMMGLSTKADWFFPNGFQQVIIGPGFHGRAWFQIDSRRLEQAMINGEPLDMSERVPEGLASARAKAAAFYSEIRKNYDKVIIGGFSQGAMLMTDLTINQDVKPDALVLMSGTLICEQDWKKKIETCAGIPFIQSHGKNDALLGFSFAEKLYNFLTDGGMNGDFVPFSGGHEIPVKVIERIGSFIKSQL